MRYYPPLSGNRIAAAVISTLLLVAMSTIVVFADRTRTVEGSQFVLFMAYALAWEQWVFATRFVYTGEV